MFRRSLLIVRVTCRYCSFKCIKMSTKPTVFPNLHSIFAILNAPQHESNERVKELLNIYQKALAEREKTSEEKKHPFIVLEGLDGCGKSTVGRRLARRINAELCVTPPESIRHLRHAFDNDKTLRTAYYSLGNYIAALEIFVILQKSPVVLDRYWYSTIVYALAQAVHDFPEKYKILSPDDEYYHWPSDLLKPDIVLLLKVSEEVRSERLSRRQTLTEQEDQLNASKLFRENIINTYINLRDPGVELIDADPSFPVVLKQIDKKIKHLLKKS